MIEALPKEEYGNRIDYINDRIFKSKQIADKVTDVEEVSIKTITELMDEIDNESKSADKTENSQEELSPDIKQFICAPFEKISDDVFKDGTKNFSYSYKLNVFKQFCQEYTDNGGVFELDKLEISSFEDSKIRLKYKSLWNDFVSIRINLFETKLRDLFEKRL